VIKSGFFLLPMHDK